MNATGNGRLDRMGVRFAGAVRLLLAIGLLAGASGSFADEPPPLTGSLEQTTRSRNDLLTVVINNAPPTVTGATIRLSAPSQVAQLVSTSYAAPSSERPSALAIGQIDSKLALGSYTVSVNLSDGEAVTLSQRVEIVPPGNPEVHLSQLTPASTEQTQPAFFDSGSGRQNAVVSTPVVSLALRGSGFQTNDSMADNVIVINSLREKVVWGDCAPPPLGTPKEPVPRTIVAHSVSDDEIDLCRVPVAPKGELRIQVGVGDKLSELRVFRVPALGKTSVTLLSALIAFVLAVLPLRLLHYLKPRYSISGEEYRLRLLFLDPETDTYSLSKLQFYLWTVAALFSYVYLFMSRVKIQMLDWPDVPAGLPGIIAVAAGTAVGSQVITLSKGSKGAGGAQPSLADLVVSGGVVAPDRVQMLLWTLLGVGAFLIAVTELDPAAITELPPVPDRLLYLMGLSSVGYLGGKMARKAGPVISEISVSPTMPDSVITTAGQSPGADLPDLTEAITEAQQGLAESGTPTEDQARATVTALSDSISAARSAQTPNDFTKLLATLSEKREFAEKAATKLASDFASQVNLAAAAAAAQRASAALQELFADVTQAIARSAASPMDAVINPALITRTITVRGSNLSPDALFEIDGADLPFRMLLDAQGKQMPDVLIRDETTPTLARVMQLKIDPARLEGSDRDQFRAWFSFRGSRTFTLTNPDGQKAELTFQLPPGETQKADTSP